MHSHALNFLSVHADTLAILICDYLATLLTVFSSTIDSSLLQYLLTQTSKINLSKMMVLSQLNKSLIHCAVYLNNSGDFSTAS